MQPKLISLLGILGAILFVVTSIVGGMLIEDYSVLSQYISETYAIDTTHGVYLRYLGFVPAGFFIALFCFLGYRNFPPTKMTRTGLYLVGIFYGLATVLISFFPCDVGCNKELIDPSLSQLLHNLIGLLTYLLVPVGMVLVGLGLRKSGRRTRFSGWALGLGIFSFVMVAVMVANTNSDYLGLIQRIIEGCFALFIVGAALVVKKQP